MKKFNQLLLLFLLISAGVHAQEVNENEIQVQPH